MKFIYHRSYKQSFKYHVIRSDGTFIHIVKHIFRYFIKIATKKKTKIYDSMAWIESKNYKNLSFHYDSFNHKNCFNFSHGEWWNESIFFFFLNSWKFQKTSYRPSHQEKSICITKIFHIVLWRSFTYCLFLFFISFSMSKQLDKIHYTIWKNISMNRTYTVHIDNFVVWKYQL